MTLIALAGDWHGDRAWATARLQSLGARGINTVLHADDFGIWPGGIGNQVPSQHRRCLNQTRHSRSPGGTMTKTREPQPITPAPRLHSGDATHADKFSPSHEAGFDDDLSAHCQLSGWTLDELSAVLCADSRSSNLLDWCYTGLNPLEVHAAIKAREVTPARFQPRSRSNS